jgi:hypothetical protein
VSNITEKTFKCWLPAQIIKGGNKTNGKRWIQGIASTNNKDLQGEIVTQKGIDTSYFINHGYFNNDHKPGAENKVGVPTDCKITKDGLWVKGYILEGKKAADDIWEHMTSLTKSGATRRMGFSIEGKVLQRNGNIIEKCWIQDIAITPAPINSTTWAEITKSLSTQTWAKALESGSPIKTESLDEEEKKEGVSKGLTLEQAVEFIKTREPVLSIEAASNIAKVIFETLN